MSKLVSQKPAHLRSEIRDAEIKLGGEIFGADSANDRKEEGVMVTTRDDTTQDTQLIDGR